MKRTRSCSPSEKGGKASHITPSPASDARWILKDLNGVYPRIPLFKLQPLGLINPSPKKQKGKSSTIFSEAEEKTQLVIVEGLATELAAASPWVAEKCLIDVKNSTLQKRTGGSKKQGNSGPDCVKQVINALSEQSHILSERSALCESLVSLSSTENSKVEQLVGFRSIPQESISSISRSMILFGRHTKLPQGQRLLHHAASRTHAVIFALSPRNKSPRYLLLALGRNAVFVNGQRLPTIEDALVQDATLEKRDSARRSHETRFYELHVGDIISFLEPVLEKSTAEAKIKMLSAPHHRKTPLPSWVVRADGENDTMNERSCSPPLAGSAVDAFPFRVKQ